MSETIQVELTLPKGHLEVLRFLTDLDPSETFEGYISHTIKSDIETLLDSAETVGEFLMPKLLWLMTTSDLIKKGKPMTFDDRLYGEIVTAAKAMKQTPSEFIMSIMEANT